MKGWALEKRQTAAQGQRSETATGVCAIHCKIRDLFVVKAKLSNDAAEDHHCVVGRQSWVVVSLSDVWRCGRTQTVEACEQCTNKLA